MLDLLGRMRRSGKTATHGLRAAFRTWATERTGFAREVVELCLFHVQGDPLERAYQRGELQPSNYSTPPVGAFRLTRSPAERIDRAWF
jgi:hypothetical protein